MNQGFESLMTTRHSTTTEHAENTEFLSNYSPLCSLRYLLKPVINLSTQNGNRNVIPLP